MLSERALKIALLVTGILVVCALGVIGVGAYFIFQSAPVTTNAKNDPVPNANVGTRVGLVAPDFTLADADNKPVALANLRGRVVVLNFWATWCGPCRAELTTLEKIRAQYATQPVTILGINEQEYADSVRGYADLYHLNFVMPLDTRAEVGRLYRVNGLPTTYFLDKQGIIRHIELGGPMEETLLQTQIGKLLDGAQ